MIGLTPQRFETLCSQAVESHKEAPVAEDPSVMVTSRQYSLLLPGTYLPPHRHDDPKGWEVVMCMEGEALVFTFDHQGRITQRVALSAHYSDSKKLAALEIPPLTWHTVVTTSSDTLLMQVRPYPTNDDSYAEAAPFAPHPDTSDAPSYLAWMLYARVGMSFLDIGYSY
uniref:Cupin fold metalloprotein WbuC cupin domain-containing protein n=1 Tax=Magnetococcus massalia (strain MO-1) TaxID=451514 RepID=A0A1S7LD33_MAGMO|nr:Conserved protein of unknown function [Candidatus Magnetococcus massalia]